MELQKLLSMYSSMPEMNPGDRSHTEDQEKDSSGSPL